MKWYKHDTNANMDAKMQEILLDYSLEGYGLYWYCLELIAANVTSDKLTFELEHDARIIARNTGSSVQRVEEMMKRFIELDLFQNENGHIICLKLAQRCDDFTAKAVRQKGVQSLENKGVRQTPIKSEKVPLEVEEEVEIEGRIEENKIGDNSPCNLQNKLPACPHKEILKIWSEVMPEKRQPMTWDGERSKNLAQRWKEGFKVNPLNNKSMYETKEHGLLWWKDFLTWQRHSDFLMNQCKPYGLDWIVKKANFTKILESKYH